MIARPSLLCSSLEEHEAVGVRGHQRVAFNFNWVLAHFLPNASPTRRMEGMNEPVLGKEPVPTKGVSDMCKHARNLSAITTSDQQESAVTAAAV
jgi:hypothetical protein